MADKLKHVTPRSFAVWDKINEIVDAVNQLREDVAELREEKAAASKPAARRAPKSTASTKE